MPSSHLRDEQAIGLTSEMSLGRRERIVLDLRDGSHSSVGPTSVLHNQPLKSQDFSIAQ